MPRPKKYDNDDERKAARQAQKAQYAKSARGKATRSAYNRASYKARHGRQGTIPLPAKSIVIMSFAKDPLPEARDIEEETKTEEYIRLEKEEEESRVSRFKSGDLVGLKKDMEVKLNLAYKRWRLLQADIVNLPPDDEGRKELFEIRWLSRTVQHLYDELYLLNTVKRSVGYLDLIHRRRNPVDNSDRPVDE